MDLTITKCAGTGSNVGLKVTTYQKPHNQYMYIPYFSFHRRGVFKGFVKAELQRYAVTNTLPADFEHMKQGSGKRKYQLLCPDKLDVL
jgi:hypothetical protein